MVTKVKVGEVLGRLTAVTDPYMVGAYWYLDVLCSCGNKKLKMNESNVRLGKTKSCGCLHLEMTKVISSTHGKCRSPIYKVWANMKNRCLNTAHKNYIDYGGRGITVSEKWKNFEGFYEDVGDLPYEGATLDRIDSNGPYSKENCRWATASEQANNRRSSVRYEFRGQQRTLTEIANLVGMKKSTLGRRIHHHGLSMEEAATTPVMTPDQIGALAGSPIFPRHGHRTDGQLLYPT